MSVLGAESYAAVRHLVTDVGKLSREERNHILWYACDRGHLDVVKLVIGAGCDVDHFHRGHTPLMMASIRGHDDVVKELILAGCKVDLRSSKCFVDWFAFITEMASAWLAVLVWAVMTVFMIVTNSVWVQMLRFCLLVLATALYFLNKESFKVTRMLRMKSRYIAWTGIFASITVLLRSVGGTASSEAHLSTPGIVIVAVVTATLLMAVIEALTAVIKRSARRGSGTVAVVMAVAVVMVVAVVVVLVVAVAVAGTRMWALVVFGAIMLVGVARIVFTLILVDKVTAVAAAVGMCVYIMIVVWMESGPKEEGADMIENIMAVTTILSLVLTWAMKSAVPFVVVTMIGVVISAGIKIALQDTVPKSTDLPMAVTVMLALTPMEAIRKMSTTSITGMTALHYAAWHNHITCGTHLVEAGANVLVGNRCFRSPLHICSHRFRAAVQRMQSHPPKQVIAVIGNTGYGKSTLIAALQSESRTIVETYICINAQVYNITRRTTGIETIPFFSAKYGEVLFYDFAGQPGYHGPHQPFLEAMLNKSGVPVTILLLVKATKGRAVITQKLKFWLQPVALAPTPSTPHVIVVGSFLDQTKSENGARQKLQGCIDSVQEEYPSLKVQKLFLLDCREPASDGIQRLCRYLQWTQPIQSTSSALKYNIHWVMVQLKKAFSDKQSIQLSTFREWLQDNAQNLPSHLPPLEDMCQDLSAAGYILFLRSKQDLFESWLVLDLQTILHEVYGTLFSPRRAVVNQFGLLHCTHLSKWFPNLDPKMIQEVLITLEFCIRVDPSLLKKEMLSLTEHNEVEGWLYFPALVSAKACEVFPPDSQCLHWACWQLKTDDNHIIPANLLQGILLHLAATHAFIEKKLPRSKSRHCCSVWVNGLSWGSTTGVDVAVQISDSSMVQVISRSREGPGELYRYMSSVTQSIFKTIAKLSPALKATPYIIHPYTYVGLDESRSAPPTTRYPVASISRSIEAGHKYVHSLPISSGSGSDTASLNKLFGGWSPSLTMVQHLKEAQKNPCE